MAERIIVSALVPVPRGIFLEVPGRDEDFWLWFGPDVGWGRFHNMRENPTKACPQAFALVEMRSADSPEPSPVVSIGHVLWHRRAAIEAELSGQRYLAGLERHEQENSQA